ncbi:hypothetical protein OBBRIDRAFT_137233 [Obba rivulosa]|uniref:Uncharacterized protein n=1 Tax=Obba rivulosa TaxID=1052685 RepID=A0A8E2AYE5_9APHY|nr:hypothetical protein OBBRIDRAFT_137233 [Obba rivulosa]
MSLRMSGIRRGMRSQGTEPGSLRIGGMETRRAVVIVARTRRLEFVLRDTPRRSLSTRAGAIFGCCLPTTYYNLCMYLVLL